MPQLKKQKTNNESGMEMPQVYATCLRAQLQETNKAYSGSKFFLL